jgi:hypothetical protein
MTARSEAGQVTAFVVVFMVALIGFAGLVIDGGIALSAQRRAMNEAQAAARAAAEALDVQAYRNDGISKIDPGAAQDAVDQYMAAVHRNKQDYDVSYVGTDTVVVHETLHQRLNILGVFGFPSVTANAQGSARTVHGIVREES